MKNEDDLISGKKAIGDRFKLFRMSIGKTQADLSEDIGVTQPTLARIESGEHRPTFKVLIYLIDNFNLNFQWLSDGKGNMFTKITKADIKLLDNVKYKKMIEDMNTDLNIMKGILERYAELKKK
jgi:transcriptional regulator with XRE-family HTH domain